jgi:hypothetical protein
MRSILNATDTTILLDDEVIGLIAKISITYKMESILVEADIEYVSGEKGPYFVESIDYGGALICLRSKT